MTPHPQPRPGPWRPVAATPPQAPSSVRRTTSIDVTRPDGLTGRLLVVLAGRDLAVDHHGRPTVTAQVTLRLPIDEWSGAVAGIDGGEGTDVADLAELVGASVRSGFGRRLASVLADEAESRSLRYSLLEDLPGAVLVSGFAPLRAGLLAGDVEATKARAPLQADICAGWAAGGPVHVALAERGHTAVPVGPPAPVLEQADPSGWHRLAPLATETVRRRRQLDVAPARAPGGLAVNSHFRDSYAGAEAEMVMHEYAVNAVIDDGAVSGIEVEDRVLPWAACPGAVASAQQVVGVAVDDLAGVARTRLVGPSTCTHLTSTVRSLADVRALVPPT
jgi:hypothetical protein